jgi:BMFP domain-containing protein YqiC
MRTREKLAGLEAQLAALESGIQDSGSGNQKD